VCGNSACTDLAGGRSAMTVPTALRDEYFLLDSIDPEQTLAARSRGGSCLLRDTRDCHDDREGRGETVLRFIRAMPATQSRAMAAGPSRPSGHNASDQGLSCSSEMSLLV